MSIHANNDYNKTVSWCVSCYLAIRTHLRKSGVFNTPEDPTDLKLSRAACVDNKNIEGTAQAIARKII